MIKNVEIGKVVVERTPFLPSLLFPLISAAAAVKPLEPPLTSIVKSLGFDNFMFGMSTERLVDHDSQNYVFTTSPIEWVIRYDQMDYIEVDPRVLKTRDSRIPILWDAATEHGKDERTDAFLDDAAGHCIASGLAMEFNDSRFLRGVLALNSSNPRLDPVSRSAIASHIGDILLLGAYFHEIFRKGVIERGLPPISRGAPLSRRQRECLELAARGLTTVDIAAKLNITVRTAQFHFDNIRSKLGAANRQEAIAKAISQGSIVR
jgi:DNA-binding CsgD family transcriptional regulator